MPAQKFTFSADPSYSSSRIQPFPRVCLPTPETREGEKERAAGAERLKLATGHQDGQAQSSSDCRQLRTASDAPDLWQLPPSFLPSLPALSLPAGVLRLPAGALTFSFVKQLRFRQKTLPGMSGSGAVLLLEKVPQRLWPGSERSVTPVVDLPASSSVGNNRKKPEG